MENEIKAVEVKQELTPEQIYAKRVPLMTNRQLARELDKQTRKTAKNSKKTDAAWATVLSIVFKSTASSGLGGKLSSALRG